MGGEAGTGVMADGSSICGEHTGISRDHVGARRLRNATGATIY